MLATFSTGSQVSDEEIELLSRLIPMFRFERNSRGELIVTPNGNQSDLRNIELSFQLYSWNKSSGNGFAFGCSAGFKMPDGSLYSPDGAWVERSRYLAFSPDQREKYTALCPDVLFEILSASDRLTLVRARLGEYIKNGAKLCVALDPYKRLAEIRRFDRDPELRYGSEPLVLEARYFANASQDLVLDIRSIFEISGAAE
jgi:Uma2 family endonuclease